MRTNVLNLGLVIAFCLCVTAISAADDTHLKASADYSARRYDPINHEVDLMITVTPPYHCKVLKVWVPIPQSDFAQQVGESQFSTFPDNVEPQISEEPVYGNRFAYFEFHDPHGAQVIRHRVDARVWNLRWDVDSDNVDRVNRWPTGFAPYLKPQSIDDEKQFQKVLHEIVAPDEDTADMATVMRWIDENLAYDHINASLQADANHALSQRRGHCSDYHGLCATMGRALGHPSRVTYGLALFPKNSPSHCKMESFLPPYGWVSFDLSETQKMVKRINEDETLSDAQKGKLATAARTRLLSGFRENSWLLFTKGTDYELVPKASRKVRVVRTAYIEADGEPLPEPDPANIEKREFAWMTAHKYEADKPFKLPFKDVETLMTKDQ